MLRPEGRKKEWIRGLAALLVELSGGRSSSEIPRGVDLADVREAIPGDAAKTHEEKERS